MEKKIEKINDIAFITLKNDKNLEVCFSTFGASIYYIRFDGKLMTLSPRDKEEFIASKSYFGKTLGRVGGRIKDAVFSLHRKYYYLEKNEDCNSLHSGSDSISYQNWNYMIDENKDGTLLTFLFTSLPNEGGFNGTGSYVVKYFIPKDRDDVEIGFEATCDEDTIFNMSNHSYFNLGNEVNILDHELTIKTKTRALLDDALLITGFGSVTPTFDFSKGKKIGQDIKAKELYARKLNGYDHIWKFDEVDYSKPCVIAKTEKYEMDCYTDFDATIVFCDGYPNNIALLDGGINSLHKGFTVEFMGHAPETIKTSELYKHKTKYSFKKLK